MEQQTGNIHQLTDHLFRHLSGKMVAVLTKIFGAQNLETAEDVVQQTFIDAMQVWKLKGVPNNPAAWLFRVAQNKAIDIIRKNKHSVHYDFSDNERILLTSEYSMAGTMEKMWREDLVKDDMLRMMFTCCHPGISAENQVTLILKTLCGFSTAEVARAFITSEDTISKRLYRTKEFFRHNKIKLDIPSVAELQKRTEAVLNSIYLLFNEGYNSTGAASLIRNDLIAEALLLCKLLAENRNTQLPETYALMALICFHSARSESRLSGEGDIILLPQQDRSRWNRQLIEEGNGYMNQAAFGDIISTYHLEAAIAYEHCSAKDFSSTNWKQILIYYELLCNISASPVTALNKAVAIMQVHGAEKALQSLAEITDLKKIESFYLYHSLLGELNLTQGNTTAAKTNFETALQLTHSAAEKKMLGEKIAGLTS